MSVEENKSVVQGYFAGAYTDQGEQLVDELLAPDYVGHFPPNPDVVVREAVKQLNRETRTAFPDLQLTLDEFISGRLSRLGVASRPTPKARPCNRSCHSRSR